MRAGRTVVRSGRRAMRRSGRAEQPTRRRPTSSRVKVEEFTFPTPRSSALKSSSSRCWTSAPNAAVTYDTVRLRPPTINELSPEIWSPIDSHPLATHTVTHLTGDHMPRASRRPEDALTPILDALRRLTRHLRLAERQIEQRVGIGGAQLFTLQQLSQAAALSVNELADLTHTHQSSVSVVVSRLVKRGLATRRQSAEDARRAELRITAAGQQLLRRSPITAQARLIAALERMSPGALA